MAHFKNLDGSLHFKLNAMVVFLGGYVWSDLYHNRNDWEVKYVFSSAEDRGTFLDLLRSSDLISSYTLHYEKGG